VVRQRVSAHQRGQVSLAAVRRDGDSEGDEVVLQLWDDGRLRPAHPDPGWRGPGMRLVRALGARLEVRSSERGTVLNVRWKLP
jgi:two-component sensor histidine kinase